MTCGSPIAEIVSFWRLALPLSLTAICVWVGHHIWELTVRYPINSGPYPPSCTFIADYPFKVTWALGVGVVASALIFGVLSLVRNVVGLARSRSQAN